MPNKLKIDEKLIKFESSSPAYDSEKILKSRSSEMIEQTATVISVEAGYAWVIPDNKTSGCGSCSSKGACGSSSSLSFWRKEPQKIRVLNPVYAHPGEQVVVGMQGHALVIYSMLAYVLPLIGLIISAVIGQAVFSLFGLSSELGAILAGIAGLVGGLQIANLVSRRSLVNLDFHPVILRTKTHIEYGHIIPSI